MDIRLCVVYSLIVFFVVVCTLFICAVFLWAPEHLCDHGLDLRSAYAIIQSINHYACRIMQANGCLPITPAKLVNRSVEGFPQTGLKREEIHQQRATPVN